MKKLINELKTYIDDKGNKIVLEIDVKNNKKVRIKEPVESNIDAALEFDSELEAFKYIDDNNKSALDYIAENLTKNQLDLLNNLLNASMNYICRAEDGRLLAFKSEPRKISVPGSDLNIYICDDDDTNKYGEYISEKMIGFNMDIIKINHGVLNIKSILDKFKEALGDATKDLNLKNKRSASPNDIIKFLKDIMEEF